MWIMNMKRSADSIREGPSLSQNICTATILKDISHQMLDRKKNESILQFMHSAAIFKVTTGRVSVAEGVRTYPAPYPHHLDHSIPSVSSTVRLLGVALKELKWYEL